MSSVTIELSNFANPATASQPLLSTGKKKGCSTTMKVGICALMFLGAIATAVILAIKAPGSGPACPPDQAPEMVGNSTICVDHFKPDPAGGGH